MRFLVNMVYIFLFNYKQLMIYFYLMARKSISMFLCALFLIYELIILYISLYLLNMYLHYFYCCSQKTLLFSVSISFFAVQALKH